MVKTKLILSSFILSLLITSSCHFTSKVDLVNEIDPDLVIINIEDGDRAFIGNLLLSIDSCSPKVIAIDSWFVNEKSQAQDMVLENALKTIDNEILGFNFDFDNKKIINSHKKFRQWTKHEGHTLLHKVGSFSSNFVPEMTINDTVRTNIALKVAELWQPSFRNPYRRDELVPINFTLTLDQIRHIQGSEMSVEKHKNMLLNKIILLGYIGPTDEDKHFTPIRNVIDYEENKPDTYGVVIMANQIRTLLESKK